MLDALPWEWYPITLTVLVRSRELTLAYDTKETGRDTVVSRSFSNDLTQGGVTRQLIRFSVPFLLSNIIQQLYSMADMVIVSHFSGKSSVVGVNNGGQLTFLATALAIGLSVGGTVLIGQYFGAKRMDDVKKTVSTMMTVLVLTAVAMTGTFLLLDDVLLSVMRVPEGSIGEARSYLNICTCGLVFIFMYNAISGILRGMGDSVRPLLFVSGACVVNIGLDLLLVAVFDMGATGAAIATVISQAGSVAVSAIYLKRNGFMFDFKLKSFTIAKDKLRMILRLGIPAGAQQVLVNLSFLLMTALLNGYSEAVSAAAGLAGRFNGFAIMPALAVSQSVSMMSAQNLGAGNIGRAKRTMFSGMVMSLVMGVLVFCAAQFMTGTIMALLSKDDEVIAAGVIYMKAFSWDYLIVPFVFNFAGLINGAGHSGFTLFSTSISSIGLRMPMALLLSIPLGLGLQGVGLAAPVASAGACVVLVLYYLSGRWKRVAIHRSEPVPVEL